MEHGHNKMTAVDEAEFLFEVDADGVEPDTVDTLAFLRLAHAYFETLVATARATENELRFTGVQIINKCVAVRAIVNNSDLAQTTVQQADNFVAGTALPPRKYSIAACTKNLVDAHEQFLTHVPAGARRRLKTIAAVGGKKTPLRRPPEPTEDPYSYVSLETMRAKVSTLAGSEMTVRLQPIIGDAFSVMIATNDLAKEIRHHWLDELDVDVEVRRNSEGRVLSGKLKGFHVVQEGNAVEAWREWVKNNVEPMTGEELGEDV